ncbi:proliferating cell nuclear antigen (pcna) [Candidatus Woesearchaeota archaeon CG10_big_fil_rev_8_21_14_0_10_34_8]|nr:MAG: proliferating cell nuclear antigen (pcna) [Candidatus Woesearchaeota archaeon CG10_big_fil_rev_8_21_14_0_10_34_8]
MKLTLAEPKYLKDSISIISELVNEAKFKINKEGIELVAMDPANVAMVIFKLLASSFVEYQVDEEVILSLNLNNLKQVLRRAKPNDMITLEVEENKLKVILKSKTKRTFSLPIIDAEQKEQKIPDLNFPLTITTNADQLVEAIEDVDIIGESVSFVGESGKFTILAEGDMSKAHIEILSDEETTITTTVGEKVKAKYSVEYLKKMIAAGKLAPTVSLSFNKDYPVRLEYKAVDKLLMTFILAPRVEND